MTIQRTCGAPKSTVLYTLYNESMLLARCSVLDPVPHVLTKTIGSSAEPPIDPGGRLVPDVIRCVTYGGRPHTVRKEIKCSGDLEILHKIVCATIRKLGKHELFRVLSRTISFSISKSPLHFSSFLPVWSASEDNMALS